MTYVPVPEGERKSAAGRTPALIPDALVAQLRHSANTGAECFIDLDGTEEPADIADLRRALIRAGYRLFGDKTIYKSFTPERITFRVGPKKKRGGGKT